MVFRFGGFHNQLCKRKYCLCQIFYKGTILHKKSERCAHHKNGISWKYWRTDQFVPWIESDFGCWNYFSLICSYFIYCIPTGPEKCENTNASSFCWFKLILDQSKNFGLFPKLFGHGSKRKIQYWKVLFGPIQNHLGQTKILAFT